MTTITDSFINYVITKFSEFIHKISSNYYYVDYKNESHNTIKNYCIHELNFESASKTESISFIFIEYEHDKISIFINVNKNPNSNLFQRIDVSEYFRQLKKSDFRSNFDLSYYPGKDLSEQLDHFFEWLWSVTDEQLIKIIKGEDWVEVPFDWGDLK